MSAKHTPGPWHLRIKPSDFTGKDEGWVIRDARVGTICWRSGWPDRRAENEANARLIAAAPDMLEALKEMLVFTANDFPNRAIAMAQAALAKAEVPS